MAWYQRSRFYIERPFPWLPMLCVAVILAAITIGVVLL